VRVPFAEKLPTGPEPVRSSRMRHRSFGDDSTCKSHAWHDLDELGGILTNEGDVHEDRISLVMRVDFSPVSVGVILGVGASTTTVSDFAPGVSLFPDTFRLIVRVGGTDFASQARKPSFSTMTEYVPVGRQRS